MGKPFFAAPSLTAACTLAAAFFLAANPAAGRAASDARYQPVALTASDSRLLDEIERSGFRYFVEQSDPRTGLVRDRARADGSPSAGKASIAVSGFAFTGWVVATERGWVARPAAVARVRAMLQFLATAAPRRHGFFYHFMDMDTGARAWNCELSSIDSSLLYAGMIVAREYYADPEITGLVNRLLGDVDWTWFRNGGKTIALGWHDEFGFSRYRWSNYSEHLLMSFMALGVSPHPLEASYWEQWHRTPVGRYGSYVYLQQPPLFINQFPQAFIDLRQRRDASVNFFQNARLATLAQRQFCLDLQSEFPGWNENVWGLTASDSATGYKAWGGPPRTLHDNSLDGTVVPCAAAGSLPFAPRETLAALHHLRTVFGDRIWKRYGFVDAFNPDTGWVNPDSLGIDVGISLVQAENLRTGLVQRLFMQSAEAKMSLAKAGFRSISRHLDADQTAVVLARARAAWLGLQTHPAGTGLQLGALIAAGQLGLINADDLIAAARAQLAAAGVPRDAEAAASLIALRQAYPMLAAEASRLLDRTDWKHFPAAAARLGDASRLTVFLEVAAGVLPATAWTSLSRATRQVGDVQVLDPADVAGALLPGLWLDEHAILPGAAAAQLAYASLSNPEAGSGPLLPVLQLDQFPRETFAGPVPVWSTPEAGAAYVITAANLLAHDALRRAFQADPLVQAGRAKIAEFGEATFGANTSIIAQAELSGAPPLPPQRETIAVADSLPRDQWQWQTVAGSEYQESTADLRPGDAPLSFRFAVTWDAAALHFHAEVTDTPAGFNYAPERNRLVELYVDPAGDGLVWTGAHDYQFAYRLEGGALEQFNHVATSGVITPTAHGYTVEATIPWSSIGLTPKPGLEFGLTPAATAEGTHEWEEMIKLNWSDVQLKPGLYRLGRVRLE